MMTCVDNVSYFFFFFNDTATTEIYTLSLHDALPIYRKPCAIVVPNGPEAAFSWSTWIHWWSSVASANVSMREDRKSTRLNSSHANISYAVFCLKKKNNTLYDFIIPLHPPDLICPVYT